MHSLLINLGGEAENQTSRTGMSTVSARGKMKDGVIASVMLPENISVNTNESLKQNSK